MKAYKTYTEPLQPGAMRQSGGVEKGISWQSRQYCPIANRGWEDRFPGIFKVRDGSMDTSCLTGLGLGAIESSTAEPT